jgi:DNA polymerase
MPDRSHELLKAMGIDVWEARIRPPYGPEPAEPEIEAPSTVPVEAASRLSQDNDLTEILDWDTLKETVAGCERCELSGCRTQTVFGTGHQSARWMVIGEAPGEQEDIQGIPFVGRAGQLLNEMIFAAGYERDQVYIANVLKCRPPKNRDPSTEEVAACEGYLKNQLALVKPKIILAVGRIAAQNLLKTQTPIGKLRGVVHEYDGVPLVVTYHPAYLLRSQTEKRRAWDDIKLARSTYSG